MRKVWFILDTPELTFANVCVTFWLRKQLTGWQDLRSQALYKYYLYEALEFCSADLNKTVTDLFKLMYN